MNVRALPWAALVALYILAAPLAHAQAAESEDRSDLESWTSAELKYRAGRHWTLAGEGQLRLKNDMREVDQYFGQFAVKFRAMSTVALDGGLRFIRQNDTEGKIQGYESERRHHLSASYLPRVGRFSLGFRVRFQTKGDVTDAGYEETDRYLRFRTRIRYNIRNWKFDPDFAAELYRPVDRDGVSGYDKMRLTLGTSWGAWDDGDIGMFYRYEKELNVDNPRTFHIIGLKLTHTLGK